MYKNLWGTFPPDPLPGLCSWTPWRISVPTFNAMFSTMEIDRRLWVGRKIHRKLSLSQSHNQQWFAFQCESVKSGISTPTARRYVTTSISKPHARIDVIRFVELAYVSLRLHWPVYTCMRGDEDPTSYSDGPEFSITTLPVLIRGHEARH